MGGIINMDSQLYIRNNMKIDIGGGHRVREGYLNVDPGIAGADFNCSVLSMSIQDESVEAINASHVLEHLSKYEVSRALKECYRVLQKDGIMDIEVPELQWVLQNWLNQPEDNRWGGELDKVFGQQSYPGDEHRCGFSLPKLQQLLKDAGFIILSSKAEFSHMFGQNVIKVTVKK